MKEKEHQLYIGCKKNDSRFQRETFNYYLRNLIGICERYNFNVEDAQDIAQESFIIIFNKIETFSWQGKGSFERWMKRIVTNNAINRYHKQKGKIQISIEEFDIEEEQESNIEIEEITILKPEHLITFNVTEEDLIKSICSLPENFRIVYNMHIIDNYSHKEISDILQIPEKTSTTRLFRARKLIQSKLVEIIKERSFAYET